MKHESFTAVERGILLEDKETSLFNSLTHTHCLGDNLIYEKREAH